MCHPIWRKTTGLYTFLLLHFCLSEGNLCFVHLLIGCRSSVQEIPRPPCQYHGRNQFNIKPFDPRLNWTVNRKSIFIKWSQTLRDFVVVVLPVSNAPRDLISVTSGHFGDPASINSREMWGERGVFPAPAPLPFLTTLKTPARLVCLQCGWTKPNRTTGDPSGGGLEASLRSYKSLSGNLNNNK